MIRVLHVIESLGTGGAELQLVLSILSSHSPQVQHSVCALMSAGAHRAELQAAGIPVYSLNRVPRRELLRTLRQLHGLIRTTSPDVIHASLYWAGVLSRIAGRLTGKPVITHLVNTTYEPEWRRDNPRLTPLKVAIVRSIDGFTARRFGTAFVAVTEAVRASAIRQLGIPSANIVVIPRGLRLDHMTAPPEQVAALRARLGWTGAYPVVLCVGRLVPQKGHRYAIKAMQRVAEKFPRAVLAIAGEGSLRDELERLVRLTGQEERVRLLGERRDVPALLAAADLFVFPSLYEGFGGALVEAMAQGKPCVAARFAGAEELTDGGRTARLVTPASPEELADALIDLAANSSSAAMLGASAESWARTRFDIRRTVELLERLYEEVLGRLPTAPGPRNTTRPSLPGAGGSESPIHEAANDPARHR